MTTIVAVVGGPLLIALVDLIRRRKSRLEWKLRGFPVLPVMAVSGGRALLTDPAANEPVAIEPVVALAEVASPVAEEVATANAIPNPAPAVAGIEGVARVARIAAASLPLAKPLPSQRPTARFLPYAGPRGFCVQSR
jgi:hypothetical protein